MSLDKWLYNGSQFDQWGFEAQREGSLVTLIREPAALVNNPGSDRDNDLVHFPNVRILPERDPVTSFCVCLWSRHRHRQPRHRGDPDHSALNQSVLKCQQLTVENAAHLNEQRCRRKWLQAER